MLRYLTHKLKTQSLNEADSIPSKNDDDHDSGTESDDEGADAEELEKYMDDSLRCDVSSAPSDRASSTLDTATDTTEGGRCSGPLDSALPSDSDPYPPSGVGGEASHSSEEELEVINCCGSKRKWSQANNTSGRWPRSAARSATDSADEEEEEARLECASAPVEFRASPPAHVPKPSRSLSPPPKLFHHDAIPPHELCAASPRRRAHRRGGALLAAAAAANSPDAAVHRPSLDFEKMQQNRRKRPSHASFSRGKSYILC